jgi:Protein of unknown function (DUF2786)/SprT-like family
VKRSPDDANRLSAELERATLRALRAAYEDLNASFFKRSLSAPVFELGDTHQRLGRWHREHRTLEIGRALLVEHGWGVVVEVLKHEMAHQYVDEVLGLGGESAHGPAFRRVCTERGIDPRASGVPRSRAADEPASHALERVAKLLALAESSNEHEAQSAMNAAQRLMFKYNVGAVRDGRVASYGFRHLGQPTGRVSEAERVLAVILGDHFFVEAIWVPVWRPLEGKRGSVLEVCGAPHNLELAEYVHAFMMGAAERLWREHKRAHRISKNAERRSFMAGVMAGFRDKLAVQQREQSARGLVWVGDADLQAFFRQRHPHVRWTRHASSRRTEAYSHGRKAGRRIVLHRGIRRGSGSEVRLLPSGR